MRFLLRPVCWIIGHSEFYLRRIFPTKPYEEKDLYFNWYLLCRRCRRLVDTEAKQFEREDDSKAHHSLKAGVE